jgi:hypothetical protein
MQKNNNSTIGDSKKVEMSMGIVRNFVEKKPIEFKKIVAEINAIDHNAKASPQLFVSKILEVLAALQNQARSDDAMELAEYLIDKSVFLDFDRGKFEVPMQMNICEIQLQILLVPEYRYNVSDVFNDCDPFFRKKRSEQLLALYQNIVLQIDEEFDPDAEENRIIKNSFVPPDSYTGPYSAGQDMSQIEDQITRDAYKKYKEDEAAKLKKRETQKIANSVRIRYSNDVSQYLIDAYSLFPYRTTELVLMLTDKKVAPEMAKTILDAVRKAEKENPDEGFRIWLSKDKIFKTEAKLISLDKDEVTLENTSGRRTKFELSLLRQEDQEYVQRQIGEIKTP